MTWNRVLVDFVADRSSLFIMATLVATLILVIPLLRMAPTEQASPNPPGEVYDLQKEIDEKFPTPVHFATFILEARDGDVLTKEVLSELKRNRDLLLSMDEQSQLSVGDLEQQPYLFRYFDDGLGTYVTGIITVLEYVESALSSLGLSLESASETQLKIALSHLLSDPNSRDVLDLLSIKTEFVRQTIEGNEVDWWTSPAMFIHVMADNEKLGGAGLEIGIGGGPDVINKERLNRKIGSVLSGSEFSYEMWGIAIDANLESEDEGKAAGIFIMFTVIGAVLVVGLSLQSYWATAISGIGLGVLMIWLKGLSALVGLKSGLVIDLIVPIGMISLGVDFVVHALRRYREERASGYIPSIALRIGLSGVLGALLLAMVSDSIAFLSNLSSSIEAVIQFGSAAAIAVVSSFIVLGVVAPVISMKVDELLVSTHIRMVGVFPAVFRVIGSISVAVVSGGAVIMMVAVSKLIGLIILGLASIGFICVPVIILLIVGKKENYRKDRSLVLEQSNLRLMNAVERVVVGAVSNATIVLLSTVVLTTAAVFFALKLEPTFDVKDFFDSNSDFVIGLDKLDHHKGEEGGEPGVLYIRGDLMNPDALIALVEFMESLRDVGNVAQTPSGEVTFGLNVVSVAERFIQNAAFRSRVERETGVILSDTDLNGLPDTREQMQAAFGIAQNFGVFGGDGELILSESQVRSAVYYVPGEENLTTISFQIPGTRNQSVVTKASDALGPLLEELESHPLLSKVGLTGSPFTREAQLSASTRTLYTSLPIAVVAATILLLVSMKSIRYALVTVVPIGLVVAWLYGVMYVAGFALNFVTAMIGAISIGVGIDYSIHMTQRFREEIRRNRTRIAALRRSARGTGVALVSSAVSSMVGFAIMGLAPMPMFASYGQLTSVMILFALLSSLIVLPCLLMVVTSASDVTGESQV